MMDPSDNTPPEVTIEPADNGFVVRHHQRGKKDEPGRTIRRVASTDDEALSHAKSALNGGGRTKKKSSRDGRIEAGATEDLSSSPAAHAMHASGRGRSRARRRRSRISSRRS